MSQLPGIGVLDNLSRAARAISVSPSVISHAVASLEEETGQEFFHRVGKRITLTISGSEFQAGAEKILDQVDSLINNNKRNAVLKGQYRIAASHVLAARVLTPAWSELQTEHPLLIGEISAAETRSIVSDVLAGRLDLGLCFSPLANKDLINVELDRGQQILATRKSHPLQKMKRDFPSALSSYPAAIHRVTDAHDLEKNFPVLRDHGIEIKVTILYDHGDIAVEKVIHSDVWTLIPDTVLEFHGRRLKSFHHPKS